MKFNSFIALLMILSSVLTQELPPFEVLEKSVTRLNNRNISFLCDIKLQSLSQDPNKLGFQFHSYWVDSDNYYSYIKFKSPIDYKGTEIWAHYSDQIIIKKRMPINNKIVDIEDNFEGLDIVNFFNLNNFLDEIKKYQLSIEEAKLNKKEIYLVKCYKKKSKKKSINFYIDKNDFFIYQIDWNNKRGALNKILLFKDWEIIDGTRFPKNIIYEDLKKGSKITCKLDKINFDSLSSENIDLIKIGFNDD
tara:strand:+ start:1338 stop:2081 length:744 start_codon:yes stop_codon:yes gene_type:complete